MRFNILLVKPAIFLLYLWYNCLYRSTWVRTHESMHVSIFFKRLQHWTCGLRVPELAVYEYSNTTLNKKGCNTFLEALQDEYRGRIFETLQDEYRGHSSWSRADFSKYGAHFKSQKMSYYLPLFDDEKTIFSVYLWQILLSHNVLLDVGNILIIFKRLVVR